MKVTAINKMGCAAAHNDRDFTIDKDSHIGQSIILMPHVVAQKYRATSTNMPWIKEPIASIEGDRIYLLID